MPASPDLTARPDLTMRPGPAPLTVVKCGGALAPGPVCADVAALAARGERVVLVHGGAKEITRLAGQLGVPERTLLSPAGVRSRHTDAAMLDVITLAMTGRAKPGLLAALAAAGASPVGLTGLDAGLLRARRKAAKRTVSGDRVLVVRDDYSGVITGVATGVLDLLLSGGFVPVVSPPAAGEDGHPLNVDADRAAAAVAAALGAQRLILLTGVPGLLADVSDETSVLPRCALPAEGPVPPEAAGGMHRKLIAAREALTGGVPDVIIADGRRDHPLAEPSGTVLEVCA
jgi:acetylglutamate/LysW-gamma-L-alpha-aminoadipate kinase